MKLPSLQWRDYAGVLVITCACTAAAYPFYPTFDSVNVIMLYLLGTTVGALRYGRGPCAMLAVTNMLAFDFFYVPPVWSFDVADTQYLFTLAVLLLVALVIAHLTVNVSRHRNLADMRERRTSVLYAISRELAVASDAPVMAAAALRHIGAIFHSSAVVLTADQDGRFAPLVGMDFEGETDPALMRALDVEFAAEVAAHGERVTRDVIYQPLRIGGRVEGMIAMLARSAAQPLHAEQYELLDAVAVQLGLALHRARLAEAAEAARISEEKALLRNTLLASISHDLRTPLSAIAGAGSLIAQSEYILNVDRRITLGELIERTARDMSQQLSNILEMMQMEHCSAPLNADWHPLEDLIEHSLRVNQSRLCQWRIVVELPCNPPYIMVDGALIVQTLSNLLENAVKYTPPGTTITISAATLDAGILLVVEDDGPGLPAGDPERLFEKFHRGRVESNILGVGLGLAICRAVTRLHGGEIRAMSSAEGGARFEITLPVDVQVDDLAAVESEMLPVRA